MKIRKWSAVIFSLLLFTSCSSPNLGLSKNDDSTSDNSIVESDSTAETVTEEDTDTVTEKPTETVTETDTDTDKTTTSVTTTAETTAETEEPKKSETTETTAIPDDEDTAEDSEISDETLSSQSETESETENSDDTAYDITNIAKTNWEYDCNLRNMTAYDSENNALYYFDNATNGSLYVYFIDEKSSEEVCEVSELLPSDDNNAILYGFVTNPYTEDVYLCGYEGAYEGMWLLNLSVESEEVHEFPNYRLSISDNIFFVSEDTFYYCQKYGASGKIVDISDSSETDVSLIPDYEINGVDVGDYRIDYLFEYGDCFYGIVKYGTDFYSVLKLTNLYDCEYEELGTLKADNADSDDLDYTGFYFTDNTLYYKDENNNIYTVNLDDFSTDIQTESSLFEKNSKDFLSSKCSDLAVTKNGDIITYDSSDNQLKIIEK